jgi:acyl-coenzyme A thioesterase PaaI-like protein
MAQELEAFARRVPEEAPNTFSGQMQPTLVSCDEKGKSLVFSFETQDWMRNPGGAVHGGVIAEAISMTINALAWYYADKKQNPAISIQLSYPRPALIGKTIYVRATAIHAGKSMAYVGALAWQDDREDKPFATGTGVHYTAAAVDDDD